MRAYKERVTLCSREKKRIIWGPLINKEGKKKGPRSTMDFYLLKAEKKGLAPSGIQV